MRNLNIAIALVFYMLLVPSLCLADDGIWQWSFPESKCNFLPITIDGFVAESIKRGMTCQLNPAHDEARIVECIKPKAINFYFFSNKTSCETARHNFKNPEYGLSCKSGECFCTTEISATLDQLYKSLKESRPYCQLIEKKTYRMISCIDPATKQVEFHFGANSAQGCKDALVFAKDLRKSLNKK